MKSWLKGGLIGGGIAILIELLNFLLAFFMITTLPLYKVYYFLNRTAGTTSYYQNVLIFIIICFIIGAIIGLIIGKIKNRKKRR